MLEFVYGVLTKDVMKNYYDGRILNYYVVFYLIMSIDKCLMGGILMGTVYKYDTLKELHILMTKIITTREILENMFLVSWNANPTALAVEKELDDLCVRYMRLHSEQLVVSF